MRERIALLALLGTSFAPLSVQAGEGIVPPDGREVWPQWQARVTVSTSTLAPVSLIGGPDTAQRGPAQLGVLVGDYYFNMPGLSLPASLGGLRATGGLLASVRGLAWGQGAAQRSAGRFGVAWSGSLAAYGSDTAPDPMPYLGLGYTGQSLKGGWGISADLGLVAEYAGGPAARQTRSLFGVQGLDNAARDLRLSPVLQVGVSYAF